MSGLFTRFKDYLDLKNNLPAKLYLVIFYVINAVFLYLEVSKSNIKVLFDAHPEQQEFYFYQAQSITHITSFLDILLEIVSIAYLIWSYEWYKEKGNKGIVEYLIISSASLLSVLIFSYIIHAIFSAYYLWEPIIVMAEVIILGAVLSLFKVAFEFLLPSHRHKLV